MDRGLSSRSAAIELRNKELEQKLADLDMSARSGGLSSRSAAIQLRNKELEQILAKEKRNDRSPRMSSASLAVHEKNKELERRLADVERRKSASGRVMSDESVALHEKNQELKRRLADVERRKSTSGRVMSDLTLGVVKENAELERKFSGSLAEKREGLSVSRQNMVDARVLELKKLIKASQELDLAFLVDATGSMEAFIDLVKQKAPSIADGVKKAWPKLKLRVAFAPYRDYGDAERDGRETCDFTDDFSGRESVFVRAVSQIRAGGGGDAAEDIFTGIQRIASLSWKSRTRVLVHIGDAPCHGREFHEGVYDNYPEGDKEGRDIQTLLRSLRDGCQIISYLFCHINDSTKKMVRVFKKNCDNEDWIQEEKLDEIHKFVDIVVNVSTASISWSLHVGHSGKVVPKFIPLTVNLEKPLWHTIPQQEATQIRYKLPKSLDFLFHVLSTNGKLDMEDMPNSRVQIAHNPFSGEGSLRWPYHAMVHQYPDPPRCMVVKRFKETLGQDVRVLHAKEAYYEQMEVQTVAAKMAEEFNNELQSCHGVGDYKTVQFTEVSSLRVGSRFYNMERFLEGNWIRYSNNLNYVNTKEYAATLHAFSHWTYQRSEGLLVVNDLQGVEVMGTKGNKEFWLCDPAINCKDALRYERTRTNWGTPGMMQFLEAHECNHVCRGLGLNSTRSRS